MGLKKQTRANDLTLPERNQHTTEHGELSQQSTEAHPLTNRGVTRERTGSRRIRNWRHCHTHLWCDHSYTKLPLAWAGLMVKK